MKKHNKRKLEHVTSNHLSKTTETLSFLVNDATILSGNSLRCRKNLL